MVSELRKYLEQDAVFFGVRESAKQAKKLACAYVASDTRESTLEALQQKKIDIVKLDLPKHELAEKLELGFLCEVFGVKK